MTKIASFASHDPYTLEYFGDVRPLDDPANAFNITDARHIWGLYAQDKLTVNERLQLTVGLRLDHYDDFGSSLNPRIAAAYRAPFEGRFKLRYGEAFRAPNYLELYDMNNPVDFGNSDLDAEKVRTFEAAYAQSARTFQGTATYFHNTISNLIVFGSPVEHPRNPFGAPGFENSADEAVIDGLEFEFTAAPSKALKLNGTWTHFFQDDLQVSPDFGSWIVTYARRPWTINLNGIYRAKMKALPDQAAYVLLSAHIQWQLQPGLSLQATITNLTDTDYKTITNVPIAGGLPNRGRTFHVGVRFDW